MAGYLNTDIKKVTANQFAAMKRQGEKISMLTAYDFTTATIIDGAGIDGILVGDSASNVMAGNADTLPITLDEMIYHARSVARAVHRALVVCDMPFGTYQVSKDLAVANAVRMMKETGVDALKLEGGKEIADTIKHLVDIGIPVIGHLGLTPQSNGRGRKANGRCRGSGRGRLFCHNLGESACRISRRGNQTRIVRHDWDWCRPCNRWPNSCICRHAWPYAGFQT